MKAHLQTIATMLAMAFLIVAIFYRPVILVCAMILIGVLSCISVIYLIYDSLYQWYARPK